MPKRCFYGFLTIFLFPLFLCAVSGKPCLTARSINGTSRHTRQANREEWFYLSDRTRSARHTKSYFLAGGLPGFTPPAVSLFLLAFSLFHGFLFRSFPVQSASTSVYLHFRIFQGAHQVVISVLGAKVIPGLDGNARSSLLFSEKISSPMEGAEKVITFQFSQIGLKIKNSPSPLLWIWRVFLIWRD